MARIGTGIRPELGRIDYTPFLQGSLAGSQAIGRGIAGLTEGIGQGVESYFKNKEADRLLDSSVNNIFASAQQRKSVSDYINSRVPESATETEKKDAIRQALVNMAGGDKRAAAAFGYKTIEQLNAQEAAQKRQADIAKSLQGAFDSGVDPLPIAINAGLPIDQALSISNNFVNRQNMTAAQRKAEADAARQAENDRRKAELDEANRLKTEAETRLLNRKLETQEDPRPTPQFGFEYVSSDPRNTTVRATPGGPAAIEAAEKAEKKSESEVKKQQAAKAANIKLEFLLKNLDKAESLVMAGAGGNIEGRYVPYAFTPKTEELDITFSAIRAALTLDEIAQLKAQSERGGNPLGPFTDRDALMVADSAAALRTTLNKEASLEKIRMARERLLRLRGSDIVDTKANQAIAPESEADAALANKFLGRNLGFRSTTR
jgi:hypothetical protein